VITHALKYREILLNSLEGQVLALKGLSLLLHALLELTHQFLIILRHLDYPIVEINR